MTDQEQALLKAVLDAPDDDGPRLVYADWLVERGDPRGELIHIQCALGRPLIGATGYVLPRAGGGEEPVSEAELQKREKRLLKANQKQWLAPIREHIRTWTWKRGFVSGIVADSAKFLAGASTLFAHTPLQNVELTRMKVKLLEQLAELPQLTKVHGLKLSEQRIGPKHAAFFQSEMLSGVRRLNIWGNPLGEAGAKLLGAAQHLSRLERLNLATTQLTPAGLDAISQAPFFRQLTHLNLAHNTELDESIEPMLLRGESLVSLTGRPFTHPRLVELLRAGGNFRDYELAW